MQINISTRHGHVSESTQALLREKFEHLNRLYDRVSSIELTIDLEHPAAPAVDLKVSAKKHEFVATGQSDNLVASVDAVIEKMEQQLRKHKERVQDRHRSGGHRPTEPPAAPEEGRNEE